MWNAGISDCHVLTVLADQIPARTQAEAMKPGLQHKFVNLTIFSPHTCSDDIKWARS